MKKVHALILFAHGARDPEWARPVEAVLTTILALAPETIARIAYLEFMAPALDTAIADLVGRGIRNITVVPMFLAQGGHLKRDVPEMLRRAREDHPRVVIELTPAIGERQDVIDAMAASVLRIPFLQTVG